MTGVVEGGGEGVKAVMQKAPPPHPTLTVSFHLHQITAATRREGRGRSRGWLGLGQGAVSQSVGSGAGTRVRKFLSSHSGVGCSRHLAAAAGAPQRMRTPASVERDNAAER